MVSTTQQVANDISDLYDDAATFVRIRPQRNTPMPVGKSRAAAKGRRRSTPPKRSHKAPSHCRGAAARRNRKWK